MLSEDLVNEILNYWFPTQSYCKFWFVKQINTDTYINDKYYTTLIKLYDYLIGLKDDVINNIDSRRLICYIIILDQFSRNISRVNTMITNDKIVQMTELAGKLSHIWINKKIYLSQPINIIVFALMPLRHSYKLHDYKIILEILEMINDKENTIYKKFKNQTLKKYELLK
jgi:uncharacterized protein (DUF924 family)